MGVANVDLVCCVSNMRDLKVVEFRRRACFCWCRRFRIGLAAALSKHRHKYDD